MEFWKACENWVHPICYCTPFPYLMFHLTCLTITIIIRFEKLILLSIIASLTHSVRSPKLSLLLLFGSSYSMYVLMYYVWALSLSLSLNWLEIHLETLLSHRFSFQNHHSSHYRWVKSRVLVLTVIVLVVRLLTFGEMRALKWRKDVTTSRFKYETHMIFQSDRLFSKVLVSWLYY